MMKYVSITVQLKGINMLLCNHTSMTANRKDS